MINERGRHIWRRNGARGYFCSAQQAPLTSSAKAKIMTSAMVVLGMAVAATSAACYALLTRAEKIRRHRRPAGDSPTDGSFPGGDGWAAASWFGGYHSATDSSGNPSDFSGGDGGGGDGGGGDGGGGGD
jgi:hypothetical protein